MPDRPRALHVNINEQQLYVLQIEPVSHLRWRKGSQVTGDYRAEGSDRAIQATIVRCIGLAQCQMRHVPLARAGLMPTQRRMLDVNGNRNPQEGRMVDALALAAEEGRGHAAKCPGEALAACDPGVSEWGNPPGARPGT